ncbi:MAG: hypothetical protein ACR2N9_02800, partial [Acidimicrobiia bacterium]
MPTMQMTAFRTPIAVVMWVLSVVLIVVGLLAGSVGPAGDDGFGEAFGISLIVLAFSTTGLVLAVRVPMNRMGWLYLSSGVLGGISVSSYLYAQAGLSEADPSEAYAYAAAVSAAVYFPWILSMISLPVLLFPTGYPPSRRWLWLQWLIGGVAIVLFVGRLLSTSPIADLEPFTSPIGIVQIDRLFNLLPVAGLVIASLLVSLLGPPVALVYRYKRADGLQRQQLKWLVYAAGVAAAGLALTYTIGEMTDSALVSGATALGLLGVLGIPIATGAAVTRYRLYDLDRVISRTVSY